MANALTIMSPKPIRKALEMQTEANRKKLFNASHREKILRERWTADRKYIRATMDVPGFRPSPGVANNNHNNGAMP
jgi:hypothetical protein